MRHPNPSTTPHAPRWLLGLALLLPLACMTEADEADESIDTERSEQLDEATHVLSPQGDDDRERLRNYGKDAFVAPVRVPAPELGVDRDALDPTTAASLTHGFAGHDALFVRRRVDDGRASIVEDEGRSGLLEQASIDPMRAHLPALAEQTGLDLGVSVRMEKRAEEQPVEITEAIVFRGRTPEQIGADERYSASVDATARVAMAERELTTRDPVVDDDGRLLVYATFAPRVPADAPQRVDWLAAHESREQAMRDAELERQDELQALMAGTARKLSALGLCELEGRSRAAHSGYLRCTPEELRALASEADFVVELDVIDEGRSMGMRGDDMRGATGMQTQTALAAAYSGEHEVAGTGRATVEVALLDGEGFYRAWEHPAFDDVQGGASRIDTHLYCYASGNCYTDTVSGSPLNHGATAMSGAFSHLLQGQDPAVVNGADREDRSHGAYEATIETYRWLAGGGEPALVRASDPAQGDGVDIAAISWGNDYCSNVDAHTAWRDAWDFAYSHGTFGVISAGNTVKGTNDECTANGWATRVDMLVAGAFGDNVGGWVNGKGPTPISSWTYDTQPLMGWHWTDMSQAINCVSPDASNNCWSSAYGGGKLRFGGTSVINARGVVDVVAPSGRELGPHMTGPGASTYGTQCCGTSMAAPEAASAAVTLKDWANAQGHGVFTDPGFMHVNMLLMGDGTRGYKEHDPGGSPAGSTAAMDPLWGAGRLKMRLYTEAGMDGPWAWGTGAFWIYDGDVVDVPIGGTPMNADVDSWTGALAWDEPYLNANDASHSAADIVFRVVVTNPTSGVCVNPGGSGGTIVYSDMSYDPQKVIRLRPGVIEQLHGKCAWMRFQALDVPTGPDGFARRLIYRADAWEDLDREAQENLANIE
ncbi:S8 family serine peptidase [Paraliomyxa miuraensis]|uniref:S8 family serine peptidase n=1 Tax=Paraliomyxa miuraensis TaxID=376150 RepID=UPI00224F9ADA|nr:S8 family serine peptidase [Paraliomyxa miuraensis]MCX4246778.1 S8 family peptidase [Paraliomyxa miuraensis]